MNFRNIILFSIISINLISCNSSKENSQEEKYKAELANHAKGYMASLKSVLVKNLKKGGPLQAASVCSDTASQMTTVYSEKNNVEVKRFSFLNRNMKNVPDKFEAEVLRKFENLHAKGELKPDFNVVEIVNEENVSKVKFVKPILIDAPCLNCHGDKTQISSEVLALLKEKYPNDKATGYNIGDLRGAISVTKTL